MIEENKDLSPLTTFHIPAKARFYAEYTSEKELLRISRDPVFIENEVLQIGRASCIGSGLTRHPDGPCQQRQTHSGGPDGPGCCQQARYPLNPAGRTAASAYSRSHIPRRRWLRAAGRRSSAAPGTDIYRACQR